MTVKQYKLGKAIFNIHWDNTYHWQEVGHNTVILEKEQLEYLGATIQPDKAECECTCEHFPVTTIRHADCPVHGIKPHPSEEKEIEPMIGYFNELKNFGKSVEGLCKSIEELVNTLKRERKS